jgi:activator of HSP90 ATPase
MRPTVELSRRTFAKTLAASAAALTLPRGLLYASEAQGDLGISHTAEAIHREAVIKAAPARVYAALTEATHFDGVYKLSAAAKTMPATAALSVIGKEPGSAFALFGGYITGRQIELTPNAHIVQVWRTASWPAGAFSLVVWNLIPAAADSTKLLMDHTGFPAAEAQHLAEGWRDNYFVPLIKYLG